MAARNHDRACQMSCRANSQEKFEVMDRLSFNKYANVGLPADDAEFFDGFSPDKRKRMIRKIDLRLIPVLALLYLAAHIDRTNIGNAKIEGMNADLGLTGIQYNVALSVFFVPYILLEVPSNILLKRLKRPSTYIGILVVSWGIVTTCFGFVKGFIGLLVCRVLLGITEAGFYPGAVYLITRWYERHEVATRLALFYCASALSGAVSGLLAFTIARMDGVGGMSGWAWIFLLEGMTTVALGAACFFMMPDTPALSGRWLSDDERRYLDIQRVIREGGRLSMKTSEGFQWSYLTNLLTDYKVYMQAWVLFTASTLAYSLKFTMPSIKLHMGFTSAEAQLLTMPPYIAGMISAIVMSRISDHFQHRAIFILGQLAVASVGFCILLPLAPTITSRIGVCYFAVVLICIGQNPTNPAGSAWASSNLANDTKRAVGIALNICLGNLGGIVGSFIFLESEKPGYPTGFRIGLSLALTAMFCVAGLEYSYWRINKRRDAMSEEEVRRTYTVEQLARMGDNSPLFRYKY